MGSSHMGTSVGIISRFRIFTQWNPCHKLLSFFKPRSPDVVVCIKLLENTVSKIAYNILLKKKSGDMPMFIVERQGWKPRLHQAR